MVVSYWSYCSHSYPEVVWPRRDCQAQEVPLGLSGPLATCWATTSRKGRRSVLPRDRGGRSWNRTSNPPIEDEPVVKIQTVGLTCDFSQGADEQRLVVAAPKGDAVAESALMAVFDLMLCVGIYHTQQVFLQQLWTAQHRAVVREGRHKPAGQTETRSWDCFWPGCSVVPLSAAPGSG